MFTSLEGMAKDNAKMIDENGDLHVTHILDGLDSLYGVSMTFQSLNAALCGLQQRPMESARTYYNCMAQITVILRECHGNHYRLGELARMSKDCFYAGLLPENCPMVVHLKDQPHTTPLDLLRVLLEQEENDSLTHTHYPPSTSTRPSYPQKSMEHYHRQPTAEKRNDGYTVHPAQLDTAQAEAVPKADAPIFDDTVDALESWYNEGFLISLQQATVIYLDDVIVYSKTEEEHLVHLRAILERFMEHGLKLKLSKCNFFRTEISYLGHKVSAAGMEPGTEGLKGIAEIVPPATYTQVHKFLGATGYFRCFIKGYARIAKPLNDLLQGKNSKLKSQLLGLPPDTLATFKELKMKCLTVPVLAFADFKKPFLLETNALIEGLGAVLSQKQDDGWYHPVAYASQGLKGGKSRYHSSKLEFLAQKWAVTDQFKEYLQYQQFLVRTDNNPLTYIMMMPNLDAIRHRWVAAMAGYNFEIEYVRGLGNKVADALSQVGERLDEDAVKELLDQGVIRELLNNATCHGIPRAEANDQNLADSQWVVAQRGNRAI